MTPFNLFYRFGVALGIGILIGLEREYSSDINHKPLEREFAGARTFALMGLLGCTAAFLAEWMGTPLLLVWLLLPAAALLVVGYSHSAAQGKMGLTSEFAALMTMFIGILCYMQEMVLAAALGVAVFVLLSLKLEMRQLVARIQREDVLAVLKFALITAVILPVLPNQSFGPAPFDVLNPYKIWLMVVLISAINFLGYVLIKIVGSERGLSLAGFLGGLVSSTAVTLSMTKNSQRYRTFGKSFALAITIAWTVMFGRVLTEVALLNVPLLRVIWPPMVGAMLVALGYCAYLFFAPHPDQQAQQTSVSNPFELGAAIQFGLLYGLILFITRAAQLYFGNSGLYLSSILAGVADVDAITLSMAELSRTADGLPLATAAQAIILAVLSNTLVKGGIVIAGASPTLRRAIIPVVSLIIVTAVGVGLMVY